MKKWFKQLFCRHNYKVIKWRLAHYPEYEPSRRLMMSKCRKCGKEKRWFTNVPRNNKWETDNKHLKTTKTF